MNKIKGSSSAVKMRYLLFVFAAAVLVSLPTRVYQLLALVDASNGFFKESDVTIPVLYAIVALFGLLFLVLSFISKEVPSPKLPAGKNVILGIASFVVTGGLGWDMLRTLRDIIPVNQGNAGIFISLLKTNLAQKGGTFTILEFIFAFFAIIYFIVFGISHLNGKASYKEFKLLALSPLCWAMTVLITKLMNPISFIRVSELLFEIFMFVFVMLFFLTFARISSGVFTEDSMWGIYGYGLTASLLAAIVTIPRLVISVVGLEAVEGYSFDFSHITVLVFILAYVFASLGVGFRDGVSNRRAVNDLELPEDFEAVTKKDDLNEFFGEDDKEISDEQEIAEAVEEEELQETVQDEMITDIESETADNVKVFEISIDETDFSEIEDASEDVAEDVAQVEEEDFVEKMEEIPQEVTEETTDKTVAEEEKTEELSEEITEEEAEAAVEEPTENESDSDELKIVSLADFKKQKNKE